VREPLTLADLDELEFEARTPEQRRTAAARLVAWAEEMHPDDEEVTPAWMLVRAADLLKAAGDPEAAMPLYRRACASVGDAPPDARVYLHDALLRSGQAEEARALAEDIRRSHLADLDVFAFIGENYENAGDLDQAHRWYTLGVNRALDDGAAGFGAGVFAASQLLRARRQVRRALQLPPDDLDDPRG
jgi:tetratricopeptide (TPR) repeat protein